MHLYKKRLTMSKQINHGFDSINNQTWGPEYAVVKQIKVCFINIAPTRPAAGTPALKVLDGIIWKPFDWDKHDSYDLEGI